MQRVFGIETEYGITLSPGENVDVVAESIALVRSYTAHGAMMKWDYRLEDPHRDARGFRVDHLLQDTDESAYYETDRNRGLTYEEIKSDLVLSNGARFYNDHAHPEYSTPECTTLKQLVAQDKAGERIVAECALRRNHAIGGGTTVRIYKNNTDFRGHSYGCHDNFLMSRSVPWDRIVHALIPFLVTRQIYAGAGKLGVESEDTPSTPGAYQISQRADFLSVLVSIDTMNRRPIVNTRDEPHADAALFRRFHVIVGDSNMSEWATAMKVGTTALVLDLVERGQAPAPNLANPVEAAKAISRDPARSWIVQLAGGRTISAIDLQRLYLEAAMKAFPEPDPLRAWVLREWDAILNTLAADPMAARDRVDWAAKLFLLETFRDSERLEWSNPWLQSLDLEYHNVDFDHGLYYELLRQGSMRRIVSEDEIKFAIFNPPENTRAFFRGRAVARFNEFIASMQWDEVVLAHENVSRRFKMPHAAEHPGVDTFNYAIREAQGISELLRVDLSPNPPPV